MPLHFGRINAFTKTEKIDNIWASFKRAHPNEPFAIVHFKRNEPGCTQVFFSISNKDTPDYDVFYRSVINEKLLNALGDDEIKNVFRTYRDTYEPDKARFKGDHKALDTVDIYNYNPLNFQRNHREERCQFVMPQTEK